MLGAGNARPPYTPTGQSPLFPGSVPAQPPPGVPIGSAPYGTGERVLNDFVGNANPQVEYPLSAPVATRTEFDNLRRGVQEFATRMLEPQPGQAELDIIKLFPSYMVENGATKWTWSQIVFNKSVLHTRAPESASRVLTHQYSSHTASLTSYGRAILVENGFFKSRLGMQIFAAQLRQLATATFQTMALQIVMAIINANSPDGNVYGAAVRHGGPVRVVYHAFLRLLETEYARFACYAKGITNQMVVVNELESMLENRGVGRPGVLIVPQGVAKMLATEPDRRVYALTGKPPSDAPASPMLGGYPLLDAPTFIVGEAAGQPINPFISRRAWGEYVFSDPKAVESMPSELYHPRHRDISTFHEGNDAPVVHSLKDLFDHSGLIAVGPDDKPGPGFMARVLFAGYSTFKDYLTGVNALGVVKEDLDVYFRTIAIAHASEYGGPLGSPRSPSRGGGGGGVPLTRLDDRGRGRSWDDDWHRRGDGSRSLLHQYGEAGLHGGLAAASAEDPPVVASAVPTPGTGLVKPTGSVVPSLGAAADTAVQRSDAGDELQLGAVSMDDTPQGPKTSRNLARASRTVQATRTMMKLVGGNTLTNFLASMRNAVNLLCTNRFIPAADETELSALVPKDDVDYSTFVVALLNPSKSGEKDKFVFDNQSDLYVDIYDDLSNALNEVRTAMDPSVADRAVIADAWQKIKDRLSGGDVCVHLLATLDVASTMDRATFGTLRNTCVAALRAFLNDFQKLESVEEDTSGGSRLRPSERELLHNTGLSNSVGAVWDGDGDRAALHDFVSSKGADAAWFDEDFFRNADGVKSAIMANAKQMARLGGGTQRVYTATYVAMVRCFIQRMREYGDANNKPQMDLHAEALDAVLLDNSVTALQANDVFKRAVGCLADGGSIAEAEDVFRTTNLLRLVERDAASGGEPRSTEDVLRLATNDPALYAFLRKLVDTDARVRLPFGFILFMPHIRYRCGGMAALIPGGATGALLYSNPDLQMGNDSNVKVWNVHYTINEKMLIMRPENIAYLPGVFPMSYEGGADSAYYNPNDAQMIQRYRNGHHPASIFVVPTPYNWKPTSWVMDIKGQFDPSVVEQSTAPPGSHYPNAAVVDARWGFTYASAAQRHGNATNPIQGGQNTVCSLGWSRYLQADAVGSVSFVETQCTGVRGPSTYRGCAAVRRRQATMYKDAVVPTERFSSVSIRAS